MESDFRSNSPISREDDGADDNNSQPSWCLGIFGTWWQLDRQKFATWARKFLEFNIRTAALQFWLIPDFWAPTSSINSDNKDIPVLLSKPKKKKRRPSQTQKTFSVVVPSSSFPAQTSSDVIFFEKSEEVHYQAPRNLSHASKENDNSKEKKSSTSDAGSAEEDRPLKEQLHVSPLVSPLSPQDQNLPTEEGCMEFFHTPPPQAKGHKTRNLVKKLSSSSSNNIDLLFVNHKASSGGVSVDGEANLQNFPQNLDIKPSNSSETCDGLNSNEVKATESRFDVVKKEFYKTESKVSLQNLQIVDLEGNNLLKSNDKVENPCPNYSKIDQQRIKPQSELQSAKSKHGEILKNLPKLVIQDEKAKVLLKEELAKTELDFQLTSKMSEPKSVHQLKNSEKTLSCIYKDSQKRLSNRKRAKSHSQVTRVWGTHAKLDCTEKQFGSLTSKDIEESFCHERGANFDKGNTRAVGRWVTRSNEEPNPFNLISPTVNQKCLASRLSIPAAETQPLNSIQHSIEPATPYNLVEILQNDIRATFTSLPNLEAHVLTSMGLSWNQIPLNTIHQPIIMQDYTGAGIDNKFPYNYEQHGSQSTLPYGNIGPPNVRSCLLPPSPSTYEHCASLHHNSSPMMSLVDEIHGMHSSSILQSIGSCPPTRSELIDSLCSTSRPGSSGSLLQKHNHLSPISETSYASPRHQGLGFSLDRSGDEVTLLMEILQAAETSATGVTDFKEMSDLSSKLSLLNSLSDCDISSRNERGSLGWNSEPLRRGHHSTQSLGSISQGGKALDSVLDCMSGSTVSCSQNFGDYNHLKHSVSSVKLNPSAKVFEFVGSQPSSNTGSDAGDQSPAPKHQIQASPSSATSVSRPFTNPATLADASDKTHASIYEFSAKKCSSLKRNGMGDRLKEQPVPISNSTFESYDHLGVQFFSAEENVFSQHEKSILLNPRKDALKEARNFLWSHKAYRKPLEVDVKKSENFALKADYFANQVENNSNDWPSQDFSLLGDLLSPGEALPSDCTRAACSGLFGPIGEVNYMSNLAGGDKKN
ncbi:hypothetical protein BY996DRAFT_6420371 [Phakopsora pachyrhizi]|nr:hypothetical protein BY996DRAFT_6420371 [Phakopsora pachyrhizi]